MRMLRITWAWPAFVPTTRLWRFHAVATATAGANEWVVQLRVAMGPWLHHWRWKCITPGSPQRLATANSRAPAGWEVVAGPGRDGERVSGAREWPGTARTRLFVPKTAKNEKWASACVCVQLTCTHSLDVSFFRVTAILYRYCTCNV